MKSTQKATWRLRECMNAAKIQTVMDLHQRINALSPGAIKYAQLAKLVAAAPIRLNLRTLSLLTTVLGCRAGDILDPPDSGMSAEARQAGRTAKHSPDRR